MAEGFRAPEKEKEIFIQGSFFGRAHNTHGGVVKREGGATARLKNPVKKIHQTPASLVVPYRRA
jgi:hypothetical protein